jgi:hypothetical protein
MAVAPYAENEAYTFPEFVIFFVEDPPSIALSLCPITPPKSTS